VGTKKWRGEKAWVSLTSIFLDLAISRKSTLAETVFPMDGFL
jgi:hypothetical protein